MEDMKAKIEAIKSMLDALTGEDMNEDKRVCPECGESMEDCECSEEEGPEETAKKPKMGLTIVIGTKKDD